ncbi:hypothetical protein BCV70DRAFT_15738 [Testicularia cyperi]|uniref:Uncharacterized protein n=1 Tax=Testicularia cyperi TaxID=1882483 RepID=A0A317XZN3_9BASI|nr:hypothetical protein BCV70DRAFT_15738 [Testicularia cyperi]
MQNCDKGDGVERPMMINSVPPKRALRRRRVLPEKTTVTHVRARSARTSADHCLKRFGARGAIDAGGRCHRSCVTLLYCLSRRRNTVVRLPVRSYNAADQQKAVLRCLCAPACSCEGFALHAFITCKTKKCTVPQDAGIARLERVINCTLYRLFRARSRERKLAQCGTMFCASLRTAHPRIDRPLQVT